MKRSFNLLALGALVAVLFVFTQVLFIVRQGEVAVLTRLGRPVGAITEPGLYRRWPLPVERVYTFDSRVRVAEGSLEESLTADGKNVLLSLYAGWRIQDPIKFLERVGTDNQAAAAVDGLLRAAKSTVIGRFPFAALVNADAAQLRLADIEQAILAGVQEQAGARYGLQVDFVGLRRIGLPESITESVFARMRAERQELADRYKAEGEGESIRIRAQADAERDQLLAQADADAKRTRADGDAQAAAAYEVFEKNPELAMFLRKLEIMEETLKERATVVLNVETEPFDLLKGTPRESPKAVPAP